MSFSEPYILGQATTFKAVFVDDEGAPADPDTLDLSVWKPDDTEDTYTRADFTSDETGTWTLTIPLDQLGDWYARMASANPTDVAEDVLTVVSSYPAAS